ncbi:MAG TPA: DNA-3-methyladenine glycosylase 2 family protein, partial [Alphaproteobacteria bacterium]|nr:DNA-3-methyladenine glycosylase 2 family protein [Alphaproteobacteria bacterium]
MTDSRIAALKADAAALVASNPAFARAAAVAGDFAVALRPPGFGTLLYIILEQQVSIKAAAAMWRRLNDACAPLTPTAFLRLDDDALRQCGFSRQKVAYGRGLARALIDRTIDLDGVADLDDEAAIATLSALKGIGRWSAECYLLWALGRRDVMPAADLGLMVGWQWLTGAAERPTPDELRA